MIIKPNIWKKAARALKRWPEPGWAKKRREFPVADGPPWMLANCLGGLVMTVFILQALTGLVLAVGYEPDPANAQASLMALESGGAWGWAAIRLHHAGAGVLVALVWAHGFRVLWTGAMAKPRELNWLSGAGLLPLALATAASGRMLVWDQAGRSIAEGAAWILGMDPTSSGLLARMFALHLCLPVSMVVLMRAHFLMVRRAGVARPL